MLTKLKICAGFDGIEHEAYIYKNIGGKKYCKSCTFKLEPPKAIKKMSEKQVFKMAIKKELLEEDKKFYTSIWVERFFALNQNVPGTYIKIKSPTCENPTCKKMLGDEPNLTFFHHILEKSIYPELRHKSQNIAIICSDCHNQYNIFPDKVPYLIELRAKLLILFKLKTI